MASEPTDAEILRVCRASQEISARNRDWQPTDRMRDAVKRVRLSDLSILEI